MGGQACVLYGAAEFSRDTDIVILADELNFSRLLSAMADLHSETIAVPPPALEYLLKGHAVHFRCLHPDLNGFRVDVMARMRGLDQFEGLWNRRTTLELEDGLSVDLLSLADLVKAKKTQRDKDWPMIRRLLEVDYFQNREKPREEQINFWLLELRTSSLLMESAVMFRQQAGMLVSRRPLLLAAMRKEDEKLQEMLAAEEMAEREQDCLYWKPLRRELEMLRRKAVSDRQ
jgi:hypothetical protein